MTSNQDIFDFETWASTTTRPTFQKSLSDALKTLATDADDLRDRLRGALFCLLDVDRSQIPKRLIAAYDEISDFVVKRVRDDPLDYAPWQSPLFALTKKNETQNSEAPCPTDRRALRRGRAARFSTASQWARMCVLNGR
jgi:hypothetical protein